VLRGILVGAAFHPASRTTTALRQAGGATLTQAGIEAMQKSAGGEFDIEEVGVAGAFGGGAHLLGKAGAALTRFGKSTYQRFARQAAPVEEVTEDIHKLFRDASKGKSKAIEKLALRAEKDPRIIQAADELGIDLTAGQMSTSQQYRQIHAATESLTGSATAIAANKAKQQTAKAAADIIEEAQGLKSMNQMNVNLKGRMDEARANLQQQSDALYKEINARISPKTPTKPDNLIELLTERADDLGGVDKLDPSLKKLLKDISNPDDAPTYALIEQKRKDLTRARVSIMQKSEFSNVDKRTIRQLEDALMKDQKSVLEFTGVADKFKSAQELVAMRKAMEEDMVKLFGKDLGNSIVGKLSSTMKGLAKGDAEQFLKLIGKIPKDMRQEVVATGLQSAFARNMMDGGLNFGSFVKWYEGMLRNKQARNALFTNLPKESRHQLQNLYRVSKGIDNVSKNFIATGKLTEARKALEGAETFMNRAWDVITTFAVAVPFVKAMKAMGAPSGVGIGMSVASSLKRRTSKNAVAWAVDDLLASNEFINLVRHQSPEAAQRLARTGAWKRFFKAAGEPRELANPEKWMLDAFQAQRQIKEEN
jgi:hypothetical protein